MLKPTVRFPGRFVASVCVCVFVVRCLLAAAAPVALVAGGVWRPACGVHYAPLRRAVCRVCRVCHALCRTGKHLTQSERTAAPNMLRGEADRVVCSWSLPVDAAGAVARQKRILLCGREFHLCRLCDTIVTAYACNGVVEWEWCHVWPLHLSAQSVWLFELIVIIGVLRQIVCVTKTH